MDDQLAVRVDQRHVERRNAADAAHVDTEIKAVALRYFYGGY
jgi:hypothetical protein